MTTITHRIQAGRQKTQTKSFQVTTRVEQETVAEAVYLLNDYIKADSTLQGLLGTDFNIYPLIADEPSSGSASYPYLRYTVIPGLGPFWRVRTDIVRYMVGDVQFQRAGQVVQRLMEIINVEESHPSLPLRSSKYKVQSLNVIGGVPPTTPDQENGVMERGLSVAMIYTEIS